MKTNEDLQKDVQKAIKWEPSLLKAEIGVTAESGVVTLTGTVESYAQKIKAEQTVKNIAGVKALAETLAIKFGDEHDKSDTQIAQDVMEAFKWRWQIPKDQIQITVDKGWITLEGNVEWNYQKEIAEIAIVNIDGVHGIVNNIKIVSDTRSLVEQKAIEQALERNWAMGDIEIHVKVLNDNVTLSGMVNSIYQKEEAGRITMNAPGVRSVKNQLFVGYDD